MKKIVYVMKKKSRSGCVNVIKNIVNVMKRKSRSWCVNVTKKKVNVSKKKKSRSGCVNVNVTNACHDCSEAATSDVPPSARAMHCDMH
eukprot:scaffold7155_cov17-Tisochrysis_lutea.AAC.1